jgi:hypothetical protein
MEFGSRSKRLRPLSAEWRDARTEYVQTLLCDPGIAAQPQWDLHRWKHWAGRENGQASMGYSVHPRRLPLRQAGRGRRSPDVAREIANADLHGVVPIFSKTAPYDTVRRCRRQAKGKNNDECKTLPTHTGDYVACHYSRDRYR